MVEDSNHPKRPRAEPEIIAPERTPRRADWRQQTWRPFSSTSAGEIHRIYVARLGPFGVALLMLLLGVTAAVVLLAVVGAVLIWIPAVLLLVAIGALFRLWRH